MCWKEVEDILILNRIMIEMTISGNCTLFIQIEYIYLNKYTKYSNKLLNIN